MSFRIETERKMQVKSLVLCTRLEFLESRNVACIAMQRVFRKKSAIEKQKPFLICDVLELPNAPTIGKKKEKIQEPKPEKIKSVLPVKM